MCSIFIVGQMFFQAVPFKEFRRNYLRNKLAMLLPFSVLVFFGNALNHIFLTMLFTIWFFKSLSVLERAESVVLASFMNIYYLQSTPVFSCSFLYRIKFKFRFLYLLVNCSFFYQRCFVLMPDHLYYLIWKIKGCIKPLDSTQ